MKSQPIKPILFVRKGGNVRLSRDVFAELLSAVLAKGIKFRFRSKGFSMCPFIKDGDVITVSPYLNNCPRLGDVVVFIRPKTEVIAVHRIIKKNGKLYFIKGDNLPEADGLIQEENILGCVKKVEREGKKNVIGLGPEKYLIAFLTRTGLLLRLFVPLRKLSHAFLKERPE